MMRLPPFTHLAPTSVDEVIGILAREGDRARVLAGGTDLLPNLKRRHQQAEVVVSLSRVRELRGVARDPAGGVRVGAMTTLAEICDDPVLRAEYPGLVRAVASISAPALRTSGTLGGNLCLDTRCTYYNQEEDWRRSISYCLKEVGDTCWVAPGSPRCWAISATDAAPLLCALGAEVRLASAAGARTLPLPALYQDDGIRYLTKRRDEVLVDVLLPPAAGLRSTYWKLRRRGSIDFPVLGVGAAVRVDPQGVLQGAAVYLGAVASAPLAVQGVEEALLGAPPSEERIAQVAKAAKKTATPMDNTDFTIPWRNAMVEKYVDGALRELAGLPQLVRPPKNGLWALS